MSHRDDLEAAIARLNTLLLADDPVALRLLAVLPAKADDDGVRLDPSTVTPRPQLQLVVGGEAAALAAASWAELVASSQAAALVGDLEAVAGQLRIYRQVHAMVLADPVLRASLEAQFGDIDFEPMEARAQAEMELERAERAYRAAQAAVAGLRGG